jgi:peptidoglycan/LPS O-acetylase OafA/YrhL
MLRPIRYIGTISYMAYLVHRPMVLLSISIMYRLHLTSHVVFGALAAALTVAFASLTWYTIERPLLAS